MIPVSDLSRDALTKAHQEYANKESAHRALGAYADDVILSGIVTSSASEGKEVKSKKNCLGRFCFKDIQDHFGPGLY